MRKALFVLLLVFASSFALTVTMDPLNSWKWNITGDEEWRLFNPSGQLTYMNNIMFSWNATAGIISSCDPADCTPTSMQQTTSDTCVTPVCQAEDMYGGNCTSTCTLEDNPCTPPITSTCIPSLSASVNPFSYSCQPPDCSSSSPDISCLSSCEIKGYCMPLPDSANCSTVLCYPEAENSATAEDTCNGMGTVVCPPCYPGATGCKSTCYKPSDPTKTCTSKTCTLTCDVCPQEEPPDQSSPSTCSSQCWNGTKGQAGSTLCNSQNCTRTTHVCSSSCINRDECTVQCFAEPTANYTITINGVAKWMGKIGEEVNRVFIYTDCESESETCLPNCVDYEWALDVYDANGHNQKGPYSFKIFNKPELELITSPTLEMTETDATIALDFRWIVTSCGGTDVNCTINIDGVSNNVTCNSGEVCTFHKDFNGRDICSHPWSVTCTDDVGQAATKNGVFYITMDHCRPDLASEVGDNRRCKMSRSQTGLSSVCYGINGLKNVTVDCNGYEISGNRQSGVSGITISGGQNNLVDNCNIHDFESAVKISSSKNSQVSQSKLHDNLLYGVDLNSSSGAWVNNSEIYNNLLYGVYIHGTGNVGISLATVHDNPTGIQVQDSAISYIEGTSVYNSKTGVNFITSSRGSSITYGLAYSGNSWSSIASSIHDNEYGINLTDNPASSINTQLYDNEYIGLLAEDSESSTIYLYAHDHGTNPAVLLNNTDHFTLSSGYYYNNLYSIVLYDTTATTISGNRFYNDNTSIYGMGAYETYVQNNQFQWCDTGVHFSESLTGDSSYVDIHSNNISDGSIGIKLSGVDHGIIYNNYLRNSENFAGEGNTQTYAYLYPTTESMNIVGCPGTGGNAWAGYGGAVGFSEGCLDTNADCFCDSPYVDDSVDDERPLALDFGFGLSVKLESIDGATFSDYDDYENEKYVAATNSNNPTISFSVGAAYDDVFSCTASWAGGSGSASAGSSIRSNTPSEFTIYGISEGCYDLSMSCTSNTYGSFVTGSSTPVWFCVDQHSPTMDTSEFAEKGYIANPADQRILNKSAFIIDMPVSDEINTFALQCVLHMRNFTGGNTAQVSFDPTPLNEGKTCWLKVSRNGTFDNFYLANGTYQYYVTAFDAAGNSVSSAERTIYLDAPYIESECVACENIGNSTISAIMPIEDTAGNSHYYYVYLYSENSTSLMREPVPGAPILVWVKNATDRDLYKIVTDSDGRAVLDYSEEGTFLVPGGKEITFAYCCYLEGCDFDLCMNGTGIDQEYRDNNQIFDVYSIPDPPNQPQPEINRTQRYLLPSSEKVFVFPEATEGFGLSEELCTPLAFLFGLMLAALYATGRNPFGFIDISPLRIGRHIKYSPRGIAKGGLQNISAATAIGAAQRIGGAYAAAKKDAANKEGEVKDRSETKTWEDKDGKKHSFTINKGKTYSASWGAIFRSQLRKELAPFVNLVRVFKSDFAGKFMKDQKPGVSLGLGQRVATALFGDKIALPGSKSQQMRDIGTAGEGLINILSFGGGGKSGVKFVAGVTIVSMAYRSLNYAMSEMAKDKEAKKEKALQNIREQYEGEAKKTQEFIDASKTESQKEDALKEALKKVAAKKKEISDAERAGKDTTALKAELKDLKKDVAEAKKELDTAKKMTAAVLKEQTSIFAVKGLEKNEASPEVLAQKRYFSAQKDVAHAELERLRAGGTKESAAETSAKAALTAAYNSYSDVQATSGKDAALFAWRFVRYFSGVGQAFSSVIDGHKAMKLIAESRVEGLHRYMQLHAGDSAAEAKQAYGASDLSKAPKMEFNTREYIDICNQVLTEKLKEGGYDRDVQGLASQLFQKQNEFLGMSLKEFGKQFAISMVGFLTGPQYATEVLMGRMSADTAWEILKVAEGGGLSDTEMEKKMKETGVTWGKYYQALKAAKENLADEEARIVGDFTRDKSYLDAVKSVIESDPSMPKDRKDELVSFIDKGQISKLDKALETSGYRFDPANPEDPTHEAFMTYLKKQGGDKVEEYNSLLRHKNQVEMMAQATEMAMASYQKWMESEQMRKQIEDRIKTSGENIDKSLESAWRTIENRKSENWAAKDEYRPFANLQPAYINQASAEISAIDARQRAILLKLEEERKYPSSEDTLAVSTKEESLNDELNQLKFYRAEVYSKYTDPVVWYNLETSRSKYLKDLAASATAFKLAVNDEYLNVAMAGKEIKTFGVNSLPATIGLPGSMLESYGAKPPHRTHYS